MNKEIQIILVILVFIFSAIQTNGQEGSSDQLSLKFSDPSRPGFLKVELIAGDITVKGHDGDKVMIEAKARLSKVSHEKKNSQGMKKLQYSATGLDVEEENNQLTISAQSWKRPVDITVQVPIQTSLQLKTVNDGDILVENIKGEIDVNNINGGVKLLNVSGSVIAHALNKDLVVKMDKIEPDKPMSFTSLNGDVDVTLPSNVRANVSMKADNGEIYSDFDITLTPSKSKKTVEDNRESGGSYKIKLDSYLYGTINKGGPEFLFKSFNGDIMIRKKD
jgi:DUF4097 and DUF4098 domain-containing protein YvlB